MQPKKQKFTEAFAMWGGPPGPQPTPPSAFVLSTLESRTRGAGADEGVRPTSPYLSCDGQGAVIA
jgi:hypothetical protein